VPVAALGVTVAVKVTLWPETEGFRLDVTDNVGVAGFAVRLMEALIPPLDAVPVSGEPAWVGVTVTLTWPALFVVAGFGEKLSPVPLKAIAAP